MDIKSLINKVIASKGILRVPSWWMKKLLTEIVEYIDSGDSANAKSIDKVKNDTDSKIISLADKIKIDLINLKKSLHTQKCLIVKTGASASYVVVDGVSQDIPANTQKIITFTDTFRFSATPNFRSQTVEFIGLAVTDTSSVTDMSYMFADCFKLTSLDLTGLDTSSVTNMSYMFSDCRGLTSLDLTGLDTSSVTNMSYMFFSCERVTSLDLVSFGTSSVTNMSDMFHHCDGLTSLDLSSFDTSAVTDMSDMFNSCERVTSLDLSSFDTSAVTNMSRTFAICGALTSLDLSSFDTSAVTYMGGMFNYCKALTSLLLGPNFFKTSAVTSIDFSECLKWTNDTVVTSLVTNSYDRASAGLNTLTLQLHANTKAVLSDEQKAAITSKGYTIA